MDRSDETYVRTQMYILQVQRSSSPAAAAPKAAPKAKMATTTTTPTTPAASAAPEGGEKKQSFERRDQLREMEAKIQQIWASEKTFEVDADAEKKEKFFCTFPYPYMNGRLHLGHAFTVTKADFMAGYQRLKGKQVLFPFAFHCTGMPIQAAATKLKRELEGDPLAKKEEATNEEEEEDESEEPAAAPVAAAVSTGPAKPPPGGKFVSKKSKTAKKTGTAKTQAEILIMSGIPPEDVPKFKDPYYWLGYFPPQGEDDLRRFGLLCDWRRSFITTDANPYYDAFIKWQFRTLYKRGKVIRGKRPTICTPDDGQACADHDRAKGEGVQYTEYTLIKMKVEKAPVAAENPFAKLVAVHSDLQIFLVAATLRPETMFGQTNCYVLPSGKYGLYKVTPMEVFVCGEHAAQNLSFQGFPGENGVLDCLGFVQGSDLIGTLINAPLAVHKSVYVLPMETVIMDIGTAVVTSVPSDSPDDFMTYKMLRENDKFRSTHHVDLDWVKFDIVHIIDIPGYDQPAAQMECEKLKIRSPKDAVLLAKAKAEVYLQGFENGKMRAVCGAVPGVADTKVKDAKPVVRQYLLDNNLAIKYYEPAEYVESRSGKKCIVKHLDQWYLPYGEDQWRDQVKSYVNSKSFNTYSALTLNQFNVTFGWLKEWACSRSFGLGTWLPAFSPADKEREFVVESLSDSTIYMAYYTVAHLLQGGERNYDGTKPSSPSNTCRLVNLTPQVMSDDRVWDFVFLMSDECEPYPKGTPIRGDLEKLRAEFKYWYPLDLRVSGKDLIQNHLTMSLYNHVAVWNDKPELWPKSFFTNGEFQNEFRNQTFRAASSAFEVKLKAFCW